MFRFGLLQGITLYTIYLDYGKCVNVAPVDMNHRVSGYREVAETLQEQIRSGAIVLGSLLPTERELVDNFGVSRTTVRRALQQLVNSGWAGAFPIEVFLLEWGKARRAAKLSDM